MPVTFEEYIAHLNSLAFWKEFTFARNQFSPQPGREVELADNLIWLGDHAMVLQLKGRKTPTEDPDAERNWFQNKVLKKATRQIRDSTGYLDAHPEIRVTNERGHAFDIRRADINDIARIVVYLGSENLPEDCWRQRYHESKSAGFIHIIAAHDYLGILEKLRAPGDIRLYFEYRQATLLALRDSGVTVGEPDIMGGFLNDEELPGPNSRECLERFVQDVEEFDLSGLIGNLHDHIEKTDQPQEYYKIMLEFARLPRSVWREIKRRFVLSLEAVAKNEFVLPYRMTFPATGCTFVIIPMDPQLSVTGPEGEKTRAAGLQNLTHAAMYDAKTSKGVGIQVSKDGVYRHIDWCLLEIPWEQDSEMDKKLATGNPFRPAAEKKIDSFLFRSPNI